ncbi:MAG TPA: hypothetical protein VGH27_00905 [Streptosporangiaceae bacterium]|jgi:hypothetical protein
MVPLTGQIEESFRRQLEALPADTRRLLVLAAADPSGDRSLLWRAAGRLGIPVQAEQPAQQAGLADFGIQVRFRHPLARSAAYRLASPLDRREVHGALAAETDPAADPDQRAWHRAQTNIQAGAFGGALELLAEAEAGPLEELAGARADLLRGQIAFASGLGSDAPPLLLKAAARLEPLDLDLARETYLSAWGAAMFAAHLAGAGDLREVSRAARSAPAPAHPPRLTDLLLDGLALTVTDGLASAAPVLRQVAADFASADTSVGERLRWSWLAVGAANYLWDVDGWLAIAERATQLARDVGPSISCRSTCNLRP